MLWFQVYLQVGGGAVVRGGVGGVQVGGVERRGPAARVPDGGALQEHLLAVAEGVAALAAARARGVEVVVVAGLQHLARDVPLAVGAAHAVQPLVVALAVRHAVAPHVLALQHGAALAAREAPRVPLPAHGTWRRVTHCEPAPLTRPDCDTAAHLSSATSACPSDNSCPQPAHSEIITQRTSSLTYPLE